MAEKQEKLQEVDYLEKARELADSASDTQAGSAAPAVRGFPVVVLYQG